MAFCLLPATLAQSEQCRDTITHLRLQRQMLEACKGDDAAVTDAAVAEYQSHASDEGDMEAYYNGWFNKILYELNRMHIYEAYQMVQDMRHDMEHDHKATEERYLVPNMLGQIFNACGYYHGAMELFKEAIQQVRGTHYEASVLNTIYLGMAHTCLSEDTKQSLHWITEYAMEVEKHADNGRYYRNMANAYAFRSILDFKDERYDDCRRNCQEAQAMENRNQSGSQGSFFSYMRIYRSVLEGNIDSALTAARYLAIHKDRYLVMRDIYHYCHQPLMASKVMHQLTHLRDSITGIMITENIRKSEAEVRLANEHREATERLNVMLTIAIVFTLLFILVLIINMLNRRQYQKRLLEKNQQLRKATSKARESDRMKTGFIRHVSHELRTPLNIINGFTQVLTNKDMPLSDEERHQVAITMEENTQHIISLVNKMIIMADEDATDIRSNLHKVNCIKACQQAIVAMPPVDATKVKVELHTPVPDNLCITTNAECLKHMLGCLLENATKFTEKGRIALTVEQKPTDGGDVRFIVEDTGFGISQEAQPFIFDRFTKGDEFSKGLGLGLAYCYETAQKLGGGLEHDTGYSHGTRFIITLPLSCS